MENKVVFNKYSISWFAGFTDVEGNFQIFPKKRLLISNKIARCDLGFLYYFSLHNSDFNIFKDNQKLLSIGIIKEVNNLLDEFKYYFDNDINIYFNQEKNLITDTVSYIWTDKLMDKYLPKNDKIYLEKSDNLFDYFCKDDWIIGLIDGEGFCYYLNKIKYKFFIEHTNMEILELINDRFSFGGYIIKLYNTNGIEISYLLVITGEKYIKNLVMLLDNISL